MWLEPDELSEWAFRLCLKKDRPEIRKYITDSYWAYHYCRNIKDDPEIRKNITNSRWAFHYSVYVKDRPEMRKIIGGKNVVRSKRII